MDSLTNVKEVLEAVKSFENGINSLNEAIKELDTNELSFKKAWESTNATDFFKSYIDLKGRLTEASQNLAKYQGKINRVIEAFTEFDTNVIYDGSGTNSNQSQTFMKD